MKQPLPLGIARFQAERYADGWEIRIIPNSGKERRTEYLRRSDGWTQALVEQLIRILEAL